MKRPITIDFLEKEAIVERALPTSEAKFTLYIEWPLYV